MGSSAPMLHVKEVPSLVKTRVTLPCDTGTWKVVVPSALVVRLVSWGSSVIVYGCD
jgi:hypothetical protein